MTRSTDDMPHDPGLDELFDAVHLIDAPVAAMVAESKRLGLRLRRRRRLRIAGAALAVAALATVATPGFWAADRDGSRAAVAATPPVRSVPPTSPGTTPDTATTAPDHDHATDPDPDPDPDPDSTVPLTREAMLAILTRMLPSNGKAVLLPVKETPAVARTRWRPADGYYEIAVRYADPRGAADLRVALSRMSSEQYDCRSEQGCTVNLLTDGQRQLVESRDDSRKDLRTLTVRRERLDGMAVTIVSGNAVIDFDGHPVGGLPTVPFSTEALWNWTGAPEWQELVPRGLTEPAGRG
ncbi:hypothetical protein ACIRBX_11475 [Kitasatospora sp. NPDC096147]|uniref:hypothetical protein n=1 Tax=Kitasatospora sp. NPDC096147 TaxID=3364093 RepID=UPI00381B2EDC